MPIFALCKHIIRHLRIYLYIIHNAQDNSLSLYYKRASTILVSASLLSAPLLLYHLLLYHLLRHLSCQKLTALAAATFRESMPSVIGMMAV